MNHATCIILWKLLGRSHRSHPTSGNEKKRSMEDEGKITYRPVHSELLGQFRHTSEAWSGQFRMRPVLTAVFLQRCDLMLQRTNFQTIYITALFTSTTLIFRIEVIDILGCTRACNNDSLYTVYWAGARQTSKVTGATSVELDHAGHPHNLISLRCVLYGYRRTKKIYKRREKTPNRLGAC